MNNVVGETIKQTMESLNWNLNCPNHIINSIQIGSDWPCNIFSYWKWASYSPLHSIMMRMTGATKNNICCPLNSCDCIVLYECIGKNMAM